MMARREIVIQRDIEPIKLLITEIEQNIRSDDETIRTFVDTENVLMRLKNERNHIIFGRRGSGKTLLLTNFLRDYAFTFHAKVNLESVKTDTLSNGIIRTLIVVLSQFKKQIEEATMILDFFSQKRKTINRIKFFLSALQELLDEVDDTEIETEHKNKHAANAAVGLGRKTNGVKIGGEESTSNAVKKRFTLNKYERLRHLDSDVKEIFQGISQIVPSQKIYVSLDDFYFIKKQLQPYFVDYFHNISKNTKLILKIASIRQRTILNIRSDTFIGVEIGDDIQCLEIDYTLDKFDSLKGFMRQILMNNIKASFAESIEIGDIIDEEGFNLLCVASGGVPRDFLSYFLNLCIIADKEKKIVGRSDVLNVVRNNVTSKYESFDSDAQEDRGRLSIGLDMIKDQIVVRDRTNIFLAPDILSGSDDEMDQVLRELVDLRFLHQLATNIKLQQTPSVRYNAFLIDMGLYVNYFKDEFRYVDILSINHFDKEKFSNTPILRLQH